MESLQLIYDYISREWLLYYRKRTELLNPVLFFIIVVSLFPIATTSDQKILHMIGPGVIWVTALLAILLSLPQLFQEDNQDGSLEQLLLSPYPVSVLLFSKTLAHWFVFSLPLVLLSPLLAVFYNLHAHVIVILMWSLLLGTLFFSFVGAIGAGLTIGLRNNGILLALLVLPLAIPGLIFGSSAVLLAENGQSTISVLAILTALLILSVLFSPLMTSFALRIGVNYER